MYWLLSAPTGRAGPRRNVPIGSVARTRGRVAKWRNVAGGERPESLDSPNLDSPNLDSPNLDSKEPADERSRTAVAVDSATGLKIFDTRAAKATEKIAGQGYSVVDDVRLKEMPPQPPGASFNAEEQARYREFKEARRGAADYMAMEGDFASTWRTCTPRPRCPGRP